MHGTMIIALDTSEASRHALDQALAFAGSEECDVLLATVVPGYDGDLRIMGDKRVLEALRTPYEEALEQGRGTAEERIGNRGRVRTALLHGDPVEELLALAEETDAEYIALGKSGSYYADIIPIGSVAAKICRLATTDVLVVPPEKDLHMDALFAPMDGSPSSCSAGERAVDLAARYGSALTLCTAYELPLEGFTLNATIDKAFHEEAARCQAPVLEKAREKGVRRAEGRVVQGMPVYRALVAAVREADAGLVVMSTAGRNHVSRLLLGSVAERIIASGAAPVLLAKRGIGA